MGSGASLYDPQGSYDPSGNLRSGKQRSEEKFENKSGFRTIPKNSEVVVLSQPVNLGREVPVQDVAFFILETPRDDDQDISFPDPGAFLDLALDPAHPFYTIRTTDLDMVRPHHQLGAPELFAVLLLRQTDTDHRCAVRIEFCGCTGSFVISLWINSNISVEYKGCPA